MRITIRKSLLILAAAAMCILFMPLVQQSSSVHAALLLEPTTLYFDGTLSYDPYEPITVRTKSDSTEISWAGSSDVNVAKVQNQYSDRVIIEPVGPGKCDIEIDGRDGSSSYVMVTVDDEWLPKALEYSTYVMELDYGDTEVEVQSMPDATVLLVVDGEEYNPVNTGSGVVTIPLTTRYMLRTSYTVTVTKGGCEVTRTGRIKTDTYLEDASVKKKKPKTIKLGISNATQFDFVKLTYGGKTYSKRCKKSTSYWSPSIKVKKKFAKNSKMTVKVINQYGQQLFKKKIKLRNWSYYWDDISGS